MPPLTIHLSRQNNNIHKVYKYNSWCCQRIITSAVCVINSEDIIQFFYIKLIPIILLYLNLKRYRAGNNQCII